MVETAVEQSFLDVKSGFNAALFKKLSPPFPPVKLLLFEGSKKGDIVELELNFIVFKQRWVSEITEDQTTDQEFYFVDRGVQLPFFLRRWKHRHRVISREFGSVIRDEIEYDAGFGLATLLLFPVLWLQFLYRKPIYRQHFKKSVV